MEDRSESLLVPAESHHTLLSHRCGDLRADTSWSGLWFSDRSPWFRASHYRAPRLGRWWYLPWCL